MNNSTLMSGENMVVAHSKTNYDLPSIGKKDFEPNRSWLERKQIQSALDSQKMLLEMERIEKESNLMAADWRPERHKAAVIRKGKHWETFGHHADNEDWLFPEEVLFLMEMNCLQCFYSEVPMSIQKGYSVLIKPENGCSLDEYRVFSHLCRIGYRVLRHLPNLTVTAYEKTIRLDQHLKERKTYGDVVEEAMHTDCDLKEKSTSNKRKIDETDVLDNYEETEKNVVQISHEHKASEVGQCRAENVSEKRTGDESSVNAHVSNNLEEEIKSRQDNFFTTKHKNLTNNDTTKESMEDETKIGEIKLSDSCEGKNKKRVEDSTTDILSQKHKKRKTDIYEMEEGTLIETVNEISEVRAAHKPGAIGEMVLICPENITAEEAGIGVPEEKGNVESLGDAIVESNNLNEKAEKKVEDGLKGSNNTKSTFNGNEERIEDEAEGIISNVTKELYNERIDHSNSTAAEKNNHTRMEGSLVGTSLRGETDVTEQEVTAQKTCNGQTESINKAEEMMAIEETKVLVESENTCEQSIALDSTEDTNKTNESMEIVGEKSPVPKETLTTTTSGSTSENEKEATVSSPQPQAGCSLSLESDYLAPKEPPKRWQKQEGCSSWLQTDEQTPKVLPERWQPPVVITELPEDVEVRIGYVSPVQQGLEEKEPIEVIDIADSSSSSSSEEDDESDSDIEIIQEIKPSAGVDTEDEDDDFEIIEVPVPKKEIIVETLSSDSEEEAGSGSESERSYDGNWKRNTSNVKKKFVRPPTMSHLTFAAVDEFCVENKTSEENVSGENEINFEQNYVGLVRTSNSKRPVFEVEKTRNEILDSMPTMANKNQKLLTLDSPDLRLIPDSITLRQPSYTFSTNALRARVFRQGFRGRRNFHGPRFSSFNPYYNNTVGNFYPNQPNFGGPQALFQSPQFNQILGGGDISSVAQGVMQIASALLMNMPQNRMNNALMPYNPQRNFPMIHQNFQRMSAPFTPVNQNYSYNEPTDLNRHNFNMPRRNGKNYENLFDMPQQRSTGTPNHIRFSDDSNSPVENTQNSTVDVVSNSESKFDTSIQDFDHPNPASSGRNFKNNRGKPYRINQRKFPRGHPNRRGGFSRTHSRGGVSGCSTFIDPAYIKPDVPIPDEEGFLPISSKNSNNKSVEIISIDDDSPVPKCTVRKFSNRQERKRIRKAEARKRKFANLNSQKNTVPEIVFLDSPSESNSLTQDSMTTPVKREDETEIGVKTELAIEPGNVKQEACVKKEFTNESPIKEEKNSEIRVKTEGVCSETSGGHVKIEHVTVEIKIEGLSDTSSVVSLPLTNLVKEELNQVKSEIDVKTESVNTDGVKTESECELKEDVAGVSSDKNQLPADNAAEITFDEPMDVCDQETEGSRQNESGDVSEVDNSVGVDGKENDISGDHNRNCENACETTVQNLDLSKQRVSSWAEIKKQNLPLSNFQNTESPDESEDEETEEIRPLLRPKHCKTISTVLSALQIFPSFTTNPPEDVVKLKITFDLYLPTEFRKSHRGLPHYRIVVFSGSEPLPTPAQLREVNLRFEDSVPVLTAVVTPGSVVFYTFSDFSLPEDSTSYGK